MGSRRRTNVFDQIVAASAEVADDTSQITDLAPSAIGANPYQPRHTVDEAAQRELEASVREGGIHEPLIVRRVGAGYQLVAGGRRLAAAVAVGMQTVPVVVRDYSDEVARGVALVENIQRQNLDLADEARAFLALQTDYALSASAIGRRIGKSADYVDVRLAAARNPDILARYEAGEIDTAEMMALIRTRRRGDDTETPIVSEITTDSVREYGVRRSSVPRRPHSAYRPLSSALTTLNKLDAAPLDQDEDEQLVEWALKLREAADRIIERRRNVSEGLHRLRMYSTPRQ
jgi:ParB/RepB/Spo0J family partition protein